MSRNRILIVDDEPAIREMVAVALELADFDVLEADNAQRAHEYTTTSPSRFPPAS